ncbi:Mediator of RNA polymerase II transcription subunit 27 [Bagarius yarrelli]|uniref:Mediator of RNA polymerase II transcription subunit 27 n=1 Tax=Bagarius yarrelli TaxID=175774 RepID=A0A556UG43_BAGYA|nr:Mediator of RNA polymerase II transcription subunit 27 [Bagarius yarrelli]
MAQGFGCPTRSVQMSNEQAHRLWQGFQIMHILLGTVKIIVITESMLADVYTNCTLVCQPGPLFPMQKLYVDDVISRIGRMFPDMSIELFRPNGTSAVLLVTLGKLLKAIVVMRSLFIDRTIVRGYHENLYSEDGKLDIWSKSNYQVFQKVTDHATTALLHYQLPQMPDVVVRSFMTWLRSYIKLFQTPCQRCGKFLQDGLPPTWRDFRTLEAFHDTCRQ